MTGLWVVSHVLTKTINNSARYDSRERNQIILPCKTPSTGLISNSNPLGMKEERKDSIPPLKVKKLFPSLLARQVKCRLLARRSLKHLFLRLQSRNVIITQRYHQVCHSLLVAVLLSSFKGHSLPMWQQFYESPEWQVDTQK